MKRRGEEIESMISDLLSEEGNIPKRTIEFVESLAHQYEERGWLFPAQANALEATWSERFGFSHNRTVRDE